MDRVRSALFVCTGNSCRSIMAEGLLRKKLKECGKGDIEVRSAGILGIGGFGPTYETVEAMKEKGVDVSDYRSKTLTDEMIKGADLILVMEEKHKIEVTKRVPDAAPKTHLVKEFGADKGALKKADLDIPDPIGRPMKDYRTSLCTIEKELDRIVKLL